MAEQSGQEKTEVATPKRRADARSKGQVPRSRELNTTLILLGSAAMLLVFGGHFMATLADLFRSGLSIERAQLSDPRELINALQEALKNGLLSVLPFFVVLMVVAVAASLLVSGWTFSSDQISLKFSRMNPITGLARMFAWRGLVELFKALLKFGLVLVVAVLTLWSDLSEIMSLGQQPLEGAITHAAELTAWTFLILCCTLLLLPLIDVPFQLWDHSRQLRMSTQEIKDENKQSEGSPELRARVRQLQRDVARRRMMQAVPTADVIVTNPTHYAVALRYDQSKMHAPVVVAKGMDLIAAEIRNIGSEHRVPVVSAPPLARALYYSTKIDQEIPMGLYLAVAKLLAYVYQLRHRRPGQDKTSITQPEFQVPEEFTKTNNVE